MKIGEESYTEMKYKKKTCKLFVALFRQFTILIDAFIMEMIYSSIRLLYIASYFRLNYN